MIKLFFRTDVKTVSIRNAVRTYVVEHIYTIRRIVTSTNIVKTNVTTKKRFNIDADFKVCVALSK